MALRTLSESTGAERRRHARMEVARTIMVSPNGQANHTTLYDISRSGARVGLPPEFEHGEGALVRLYIPRPPEGPMVLFAEIRRLSFDHIGVQFAENQDELVLQLIEELSGG